MQISIVIVEYYSLDDVLLCISSVISNMKNYNYEFVVSSNSLYSEVKKKELETKYSYIKWVFNEKNGGFAYAMNKGLAIAKGDILVIMNPDIQVVCGVERMIQYLDLHKNIGAIAPQIINDKGIVQDSYRHYMTVTSFVIRHLKRLFSKTDILEKRSSSSMEIRTVDWVIGAFIMVKREVYEITHGLDEHYFLYCEDMDWCTRIRQSGYEIVYYPLAQIIYEGTRSARKSIKYSIIFINSLIRYWRKFGFF